ncbi:MAG: hypothetical protein GXY32_00325 [Ruminococcaceae bacterium]|nr:hypothetical protein [Oscillospiraceae bacterium]
MKKSFTACLGLVMIAVFLVACGNPKTPASSSTPAPPASTPATTPDPTPTGSDTIDVAITNNTTYIFNELYATPTASNDWGIDQLGSTSILKSGGSYDISLQKYEFDTYDLRIVDEDKYVYLFSRVTLVDGSEVLIEFADDGLQAVVYGPDGDSSTVAGTVDGTNATDDVGGGGGTAPEPEPVVTGTGNDTNGQYTFNVYNESSYDIYSIHMGVRNAGASDDIDILPAILYGGESTTVTGVASQGDWLNTEWTLYITDVDGDTSNSYDSFNPWLLSYVNIYWQDGGYVCEFVY